jgi:hypothetical protein
VGELAEQLEHLANRGEVRGAADVLAAARRSLPRPAAHPSEPSRLVATAVSVLVLAALIGAVLIATRDAPGTSAVATDEGVGSDQTDSSPLFLLPTTVPEGFVPVGSWGGDDPDGEGATVRFEDWSRVQRWTRFDGNGAPAAVIDVAWRSGVDDADPLARFRPGAVQGTVRGHDALFIPTEGRLVWEEPGIGVVMVDGTSAPSRPGSDEAPLPGDVLEAVAEGLRRRSDGGLEVSQPPAGFEQVAEWPGLAPEGRNPRSARYARPGGGTLQVQIVDDTGLPPGVNFGIGPARRVRVRGEPGVVTPSLYGPVSTGGEAEPFLGDTNIQWLEHGDERITLSADDIEESQLLRLAEGLRQVDRASWRSLRPAPVTTTTQAPATTPSTAAPAPEGRPEQVRVEGTYRGLERFELLTGPCAFMSHELESTFELSGGAEWRFHSEYCGTIEGAMWSGSGTFTFTTEDGSRISGDTANSARLPSTGEPYDLHVTDGTGSFAGATGSCSLDNHLREVRSGVQEQYGTFACDISLPERRSEAGGPQDGT